MKPCTFCFFHSIVFILSLPVFAQQEVAMASFDYKRDFKSILEKTQDRENSLSYKKLITRFLERDSALTNAEVLALLVGFTEDAHYKPFEDMETEKEIFDLNDGGNVEEALVKVKPYLQTHPLSLSALKEASFCYHTLKKEDSAQYYMDLVDKVMNAMIYSGTGKKPETPIFSLGLADGESFIPNIGMKILDKNTVWNKYSHFLEIIDASKSGDDHINYYFVIQHAKDKIDDDKVNDAAGKKGKKGEKKKKDEKKEKVGWGKDQLSNEN
jgi:hypothetical protein